jgi:hypothetical protein
VADTLRVKRRAVGGAAGAPAALASAEIAFNEQDNVLYYGGGNNAGAATSIFPIAGPGAFLPKAGGAMSGALTLAADPSAALGAATKQYVDTTVSASQALVTISDTAPSSPAAGRLWFDSVNSRLYIYFTDANSSQWVGIG